ncbi:MAG: VCBS repeat-containing protein [Verrucomicrobia bacterium]|nr:VCBS repeat-containing protein [Verrucomicrobiota bacterium]
MIRIIQWWAALVVTVGIAAALEWESGQGYRFARVTPTAPGKTGFSLLPPATTGITFTNFLAQSRFITNQIYLNGAGVAAGDVDGDGWCDLFFAGLDRPNVLYRNLGNWRFEDVTDRAGVALPALACTGCAFADLDGDGDLDLVVNSVGDGTVIFLNDGTGRFTNPAPGAPLNYLKAGMSLALADVDGDGDLDLYVANYRTTTLRDMPNTRLTIRETDHGLEVTAVNGRPTTEPDLVGRFVATRDRRIVENGEADVLYLNDGRAGFSVVPFLGGAFLDEDGQPLRAPPYDWGLTATFRDLNGDGAPDLYICNDFESPDRIWINDGRGRFRAIPRLALRHTSIFSMGADFADLNRDGHDDFCVSDMLSREHSLRMIETGEIPPVHLPLGAVDNRPQYSHNMLFVARGDGTWAEIAQFAGVEASEWTWSPNFLDVDLDGYEDLLITTGHELQMMNGDIIQQAEVMKAQRQMSNHELQRLRTMFPRYAIPNVVFRNRGNLTFEDMSEAWGFNHPDVGNAVALADLDNDGDLDVVINNLNGVAEVFRNTGTAPRLAVQLRGADGNTQGIGAKVKVYGGAVPMQSQEIVAGGRYLSGNQALRVFAAGSETSRLRVEVSWRSGRRSVVEGVPANTLCEITEADAPTAPRPPETPPVEPWFQDVSHLIQHQHHEDAFDDFARQPLLTRRLSQLGPGVAWLDADSDGWDDLVIGSGKGGALAVFRGDGQGGLVRLRNPALDRPAGRDQTGIVGLQGMIAIGSSNYEDGLTNGGCLRIYDIARQASGESILGQNITPGPIAMADVDGDGDLDLFIGGRVVPGRYPEPATSLLLRKENDRFVVTQRFEKLGLVSGAVFSDLDGDAIPELVLAVEWGPIRVFRWSQDRFREVTGELGLEPYSGWWAGVATGDLDGDGRLDIVATNFGLNNRYRPSAERPIWIRYGDLDESGTVDVIETYVNPANGREVPFRVMAPMVAALPFLQEIAPSNEAYGRMTIQQLYGDRLDPAAKVEARTLASMVFFNRGGRFEAAPLPDEAQWAPAYAVCVGDFDGDGQDDVFLSQNFFGVSPDYWRQDAGRGLLLRNEGAGRLQPVPGQESGIRVYGEQRGAAMADFDGDGRLDLAVSQNANPTVLLRNAKARPALRVRLTGGPGNPQGVGAVVRLASGGKLGPAREVQAGSGYWSHNSATLVLSSRDQADAIHIRWPWGKETVTPVPAAARDVRVDLTGSLTVIR